MENNQTGINKEKMIKIIFWLMLALIIFFQFLFTINSTNQIRYEEIAESVRNPFWLMNRTIYDGVSSNVGWYATLLIIYNFFGFSLHSAKYFRFILQIISLVCLALTIKNIFGLKKGIIPLLTIGLSPTMIYFNTFQASYGIDLQYLPISLFLALYSYKNTYFEYLRKFLFGFVSMWAWMSYPTFAFYIPALWFIYFWQEFKIFKKTMIVIKSSLLSIFSFILPLLVLFIYVKDRSLLLFDSKTSSGIFRGAGMFKLDLNLFWQNITNLTFDLFQKGNSYNFEIWRPDFSNYFPITTVLAILIISIYLLIKHKQYRLPIILVLFTFSLSLIIANFNLDPSKYSGIRRNTAVIACFYSLFTIAWFFTTNYRWKNIFLKWVLIIIFLLLPLQHFSAYFNNLYHLKDPSLFKELWFGLTTSPSDALNLTLNSLTTQDLKLSCKNDKEKTVYCRYAEMYAATAGACYWNKLNCKDILGFDFKTEKYIPLKIDLWTNYYWPH